MLMFNNLNQETIKISNRKKILQLLYKQNHLTKQEISKKLSISIPTVTHNINTLLKEGIVREAGVAQSTGGRKPIVIEFLPNSRYSLGIDFKYDSIRIIFTNLKSEIIADKSFSIKGIHDMDKIMLLINLEINSILKDNNIDFDNVLGIGFSLHGTVDEENLILELAPNLSYHNVCFKQYQKLFNKPIFIENEANVAALAEITLGIAKEMRNLVYISINEGVGTGIVIRNYLYKGKNNRAGEFGHMTIVPNGKLCSCGKKGCWELYSSTKALIENYNNLSNYKVCTIDDVFKDYIENEGCAYEAVNKYIKYLSVGIQNIILILDPHYIVIGGAVSKYAHYFIEELKDKIFIKNSFYTKDDNKIFVSKLNVNASILGAALLPMQELLFENNKVI